jgi:hypothetical protein
MSVCECDRERVDGVVGCEIVGARKRRRTDGVGLTGLLVAWTVPVGETGDDM